MSKRLNLRKFIGVMIIIFCLLFLLVQSTLYSPNVQKTSLQATTLGILAGGGIVLGSYLALGPVGILASFLALSGAGCDGDGAGGGNDLGEPPNPPED